MKLVECRSEHIKSLKAMALRKNKFNDPKSNYNPNAARYTIVDDDGSILGFVQGYDTFYVEEFFIDQDLTLRKRIEIFRWIVKEFLSIMKVLGKRVWWITKKDHVFANDVYVRNKAKVVNARKLRVWIYG